MLLSDFLPAAARQRQAGHLAFRQGSGNKTGVVQFPCQLGAKQKRSITTAGKFELKKSKDDKYFFLLLASNRQTILGSEMYEAKAGAVNGIESVKTNSADDSRYERLSGKDGSPYFLLKAGNGQVIGSSQMYSTA